MAQRATRNRRYDQDARPCGRLRFGATVEKQMGKRSEADKGDVTVHVTPRGGFYVDERELLRSKAAQEMMAKMASIFDEERRENDGARRALGGAEDSTLDRSRQ